MNYSLRNHYLRAIAVFVGLCVLLPASQAHQQWIAPNFMFQDEDSAWLSFDHTFGDSRFRATSGPGSYYSWWIIEPDGTRKSVPHMNIGKTRTVGEVELTNTGTHRVEAIEDLMPWTRIKVDGEEKWQPGTREDHRSQEIVRSTVYFNKTVSYITLKSATKTALAGVGDPLELLFEDHPNSLQKGKPFRIRVVASGQPLTDQKVSLYSEGTEGHDAAETCTTNASGFCTIELAAAGRYLLITEAKGDSPGDGATDGFSHQYSVLVEVN